jgi:hypothetical protein
MKKILNAIKATVTWFRTWNELIFVLFALLLFWAFYEFVVGIMNRLGIVTGVFGGEAIHGAIIAVCVSFIFMAVVFLKLIFWKWLWRYMGNKGKPSLEEDWGKTEPSTRIRTLWIVFFGLFFGFILVFMAVMGAGALKIIQ